MSQESVLFPLVFTIAVDLNRERERQGLMNKNLCAGGLVLMCKSMKNWRKVLEIKED